MASSDVPGTMTPSLHATLLDAGDRGFRPNSRVTVESRRGRLVAMAFVTRSVQPGHVFVPMHYDETNRLTDAVFDPYSKQPSYKACAVQVSVVPGLPSVSAA